MTSSKERFGGFVTPGIFGLAATGADAGLAGGVGAGLARPGLHDRDGGAELPLRRAAG